MLLRFFLERFSLFVYGERRLLFENFPFFSPFLASGLLSYLFWWSESYRVVKALNPYKFSGIKFVPKPYMFIHIFLVYRFLIPYRLKIDSFRLASAFAPFFCKLSMFYRALVSYYICSSFGFFLFLKAVKSLLLYELESSCPFFEL